VGSLHLARRRVAPLPLPDVRTALVVPDAVVAVELWLLAWIRDHLPQVVPRRRSCGSCRRRVGVTAVGLLVGHASVNAAPLTVASMGNGA
jgi:hypothetical protein